MQILAHAFGERYELPVPLWLFVIGGAAVVFASFLLVLPTTVAGAEADARRALDGQRLRRAAPLRMLIAGLVVLGLALIGWSGSQEIAENILPTAFWLLVWIAVPLSCGIIGDWTRALNPFAAMARLFDQGGLRHALIGGAAPLTWPRRLGHWPAVVLFFALASGELIFNA